jgi:fructokinase
VKEKTRMVDAVVLGEMLIDFLSLNPGCPLPAVSTFMKSPGGAPANVAVGISRLGRTSAFIGKLGNDCFGRYLTDVLVSHGVDISGVRYSDTARTGLAFVSLEMNGERDFEFFRHPSADMLLEEADLDQPLIQSGKIFHYGSISLIAEPSRSATFRAIRMAKKVGLMISYDPNLRLNLWTGAEQARAMILTGWQAAQIIKVSEEELSFLTKTTDLDESRKILWHPELKLLVITRGKNGCAYYTKDHKGEVEGYSVNVVDTTGAGDGFMAGLLCGLIEHPDAVEDMKQIERLLRFANAVGAMVTMQRGAIPALPTEAEARNFIRQREPRMVGNKDSLDK